MEDFIDGVKFNQKQVHLDKQHYEENTETECIGIIGA